MNIVNPETPRPPSVVREIIHEPHPVYFEPPREWVLWLVCVVALSNLGANLLFYAAYLWLSK